MIGFFYVWKKGALDWANPKTDDSTLTKNEDAK